MDYGLIGERLSHSFSKEIHNKIANYHYELKEIPKGEIEEFLEKKDFKAINVTIPYKETVIPYLYKISNAAREIGAVNTVINKDGKLYGYNTDFSGLKALIEKNGIVIKNKKVLILGSGGTSKTAFAVAKDLGAKEILKISRQAKQGFITYDEAITSQTDAEVIINTTPVGMFPNIDDEPIDIMKFPNLSGVVDVIYNPLRSKFVKKAMDNNIKACGGLYMLVAQGVFAAEKFLDKDIEPKIIDKIYKEIYKSKENIVLIGMPSSGKTTIGKRLAKELNRPFIDTDEEIVKKANMEIPEIFQKFGEAYFRKIESDYIINEASKLTSCIIATGGGAILNKENIFSLKKNGKVYFIDRPIELLLTTSNRPLSSNKEDLEKRYNERYNLYKELADFSFSAQSSIENHIEIILKDFLGE